MVGRPTFSVATPVLYHSTGQISKAWINKVLSTDPLIGEANAVLLALTKASELSLQRFFLFFLVTL